MNHMFGGFKGSQTTKDGEGSQSPGSIVMTCCEPFNVGAGNQPVSSARAIHIVVFLT